MEQHKNVEPCEIEDFDDDFESSEEEDSNMDEDLELLKNQIEEKMKNKKSEICENRTSVSISKLMHDGRPMNGCDYCKPANLLRSEEEKSDEVFYMGGFTSGKFRIDDFEHALNMGACRSGEFIYFRNQRTSCCEVWNYRVQIDQFQISKQ